MITIKQLNHALALNQYRNFHRAAEPAAALYMELIRKIEKGIARRNRELMKQIASTGTIHPGKE